MNSSELTYLINGALFEVNRELRAGFLEKVYENALLIEVRKSVSIMLISSSKIRLFWK